MKFLPFVPDQIIYHYNSFANAMSVLAGFDATKPVSLLYKKDDKSVAVPEGVFGCHKRTICKGALIRAIPSDKAISVE